MTSKKTTINPSPQKSEEELKSIKLQEQFAAIRSMTIKYLNKSLQSTPSALSQFDPKQVSIWLQNPQKYEKQMRQLSNYLYNVNGNYRAVVRHMATMPIYAYDLDLLGSVDSYAPDKIKKAYLKTSQYVDKLNLQHEMSKMLKIALKEDVFFGYEHESKDSYFIQKLDADYCQIWTGVEDGVLTFAYDFSYFDKYKNDLELFPEEFRVKYQKYDSNKKDFRWQDLDTNKSMCFKVNEEIQFAMPPFNIVFESIFDADEYRKLRKAKAKMDNFLLLVQKIPLNEKGTDMDAFLIDPKIANQFHENTAANLGEGIGLTTTPMEIEAISLDKKQANGNSSVTDAVSEIFTNSAISQHLFGTEKGTSMGISQSIKADEQIVFDMMTQIERWLNRKLKKLSGAIKFHLTFLDITEFNKKEEREALLKAGTLGLPDVAKIAATYGISPNQLYNKAIIENQILDLHSLLRPLQSSHTTANDGSEGGRPKASDENRSDSTQTNIDNSDE